MIGDVEASRERQIRAELVCNLCGRAAATVLGPWAPRFVPKQLVLKDSEHASAVRRLQCPHCGGRLMLQNEEEILVFRGPLPDEDRARVAPGMAEALEKSLSGLLLIVD